MRNKALKTLLTISLTISTTFSIAQNLEISPNASLSKQLVDKLWANREEIKNQEIIANYLETKPSIPNDYEVAWKTARLVYFIGNFGIGEKYFVSTKAGVNLFNYGVEAGKKAIELNPKNVEGYYWYAVDLGSYGLAKGIIASASNAKSGMKALKQALEIDPQYANFGSSRILGRYYQELPGIFGGNKDKALALLKDATLKAPEFRNNWVFLGQYYISEEQYNEALEACTHALNCKDIDGKYEEERYKREANICVQSAKSKLN